MVHAMRSCPLVSFPCRQHTCTIARCKFCMILSARDIISSVFQIQCRCPGNRLSFSKAAAAQDGVAAAAPAARTAGWAASPVVSHNQILTGAPTAWNNF